MQFLCDHIHRFLVTSVLTRPFLKGTVPFGLLMWSGLKQIVPFASPLQWMTSSNHLILEVLAGEVSECYMYESHYAPLVNKFGRTLSLTAWG